MSLGLVARFNFAGKGVQECLPPESQRGNRPLQHKQWTEGKLECAKEGGRAAIDFGIPKFTLHYHLSVRHRKQIWSGQAKVKCPIARKARHSPRKILDFGSAASISNSSS